MEFIELEKTGWLPLYVSYQIIWAFDWAGDMKDWRRNFSEITEQAIACAWGYGMEPEI